MGTARSGKRRPWSFGLCAFVLGACGTRTTDTSSDSGTGYGFESGGPESGRVASGADAGTIHDGSSDQAIAQGDDAPSSSRPSPFDWVGIIGTGQSLSVGWQSTAISSTQPFHNVTLADLGPDPKYPIDGAASARWALTPLVEPIRVSVPGPDGGAGYGDWQYPDNIWSSSGAYGETPHSGMANTLSATWAARGMGDYVTAHTVVGWSGQCLQNIDKEGGQRAYPASLSETRVFKSLADAAGKTYGVGGIVLTHGECDATIANPNYEAGVYQMWQDYDADLKAITGQTRDVVLFASQQSSIEDGYGSTSVQIWKAGVDHPGQIVCTGPKYAFGCYDLHMPGPGYERVGEKYGEVFDLVVNQGVAWKPLGPNNVTRSGAVITIDFDVPNPPLVWDAHLAPPHQTANTAWANGKGFEVVDGAMNQVAIASVEIQGTSVVLTLAQAPAAGTTLTVAYALTQDGSGDVAGCDDGMHGLLRDSDAFVGFATETIAVQVTSGSTSIAAAGSGAFDRRGALDLVTGGGLPEDTVLMSVDGDSATLSTAWSGATGTASLMFHHNHHNYCVHFAMPSP